MSDVLPPAKKFIDIKGRRMAFIGIGEGAPIVFQHGNAINSIAQGDARMRWTESADCLRPIGMIDSEGLSKSEPAIYYYAQCRDYLLTLRRRAVAIFSARDGVLVYFLSAIPTQRLVQHLTSCRSSPWR